ncbi:cadherin-like domain-containing protein, partial [Shewanella frigidimarina]|uniref:cadherin-like domain-containing protein n=1 Tax=Shewanella frigidimarina TaxID=56812 RepID=UPI0013666F83
MTGAASWAGPITVTGFTIAGDTTVYDADGTDITLTNVGTFSLDSDGVYTFTPVANYNGTVPVITFTITRFFFSNHSSSFPLTFPPFHDNFSDYDDTPRISAYISSVTGNVILLPSSHPPSPLT